MTNQAFGKSLRLLNAHDYKTVFDDAQVKVSNPQVLFLSHLNGLSGPRLGLVIAKKNVRHAVQRNRIKRIIRDTFRLNQQSLAGLDIVVLARRGIDQLDNPTLQQLFNDLWKQLQKRAQKKLRLKQSPEG